LLLQELRGFIIVNCNHKDELENREKYWKAEYDAPVVKSHKCVGSIGKFLVKCFKLKRFKKTSSFIY
jgi:hypothetical protein